jgi:hypothetical protein
MFLSILFAFIVKDFYDIFIQNHIKSYFSKYKLYVVSNNKRSKKK